MPDLPRHLRGAAIAVVVLAMTAGVAFAASPSAGPRWNLAALDGLFAGHDGAQGDEQGQDQGDESEPPESEAPESEAPDQSETDASEAPDSEAPEDAGASPGAHGTLVSTAANMTTPDGFANHGAFVRCVAHLKGVDPTTFDWTTLTPAFCADTWGHAPKSHGKHGHHQDS